MAPEGSKSAGRSAGEKKPYMLKRAAILVLFIMLAGCASRPLLQANFDVRESYRSSAFKNAGTEAVIGLLSASDESGPEYKKLLGEFVEEALRNERPDVRLVPYWQSISHINSKGFTKDYAEMLKSYGSTGILDRDTLKKLGVALGVNYILQPRLISFNQSQSTRFSALGLTLFKTHESSIKIYIELWNVETGEIAWIGVGDANMASEHFRAKPIPFESVAKFAIENLIKKMP